MRGAIVGATVLAAACSARVPMANGVPCDTARIVTLGDTLHHVVYATLALDDTTTAAAVLPEGYAELVLHSVTNGLALPSRLNGPVADSVLEPIALVLDPGQRWPRLVFPDPPSRIDEYFRLATAVSFGLRADGRLVDLAVSRVSSELALTRALVVAALAADSLRLVPARPPGADTATVRLRLSLALEQREGIVSRPLFRAALPRRFDVRPEPIEDAVRSPRFRPQASPGQEWRADIRFVLDASGRPVEESIETLAATDTAWAQATRAALARSRYTPAVLDGCPVRVRVIQPWTYVVR